MYAPNDIVFLTKLCTSDHIFQSSNAALTKQFTIRIKNLSWH